MTPRHERRLIEPQDDAPLYFGERVHNFRVLKNWTQEIAAAWWGVHPRTWRRWERGDTLPPVALRRRIVEHIRRSCPEYVRYVT